MVQSFLSLDAEINERASNDNPIHARNLSEKQGPYIGFRQKNVPV